VFDEIVYSFRNLNPNDGACLKSEILLLPTQTQLPLAPPSGVQIIDDSMTTVHALSVPTNVSNLFGDPTKQFKHVVTSRVSNLHD
jgi:hypothetical protein